MLGKNAFHIAAKVRFTDSRWNPQDSTLNHAAYRVALFFRRQNLRLHFCTPVIIQHRKRFFTHLPKQLRRQRQLIVGKVGVLYVGNLPDVGAHHNSTPGQNLLGHRPGKDQRRREPSGKMAAASVVVTAAVPDKSSVIRMARTGQVLGFS